MPRIDGHSFLRSHWTSSEVNGSDVVRVLLALSSLDAARTHCNRLRVDYPLRRGKCLPYLWATVIAARCLFARLQVVDSIGHASIRATANRSPHQASTALTRRQVQIVLGTTQLVVCEQAAQALAHSTAQIRKRIRVAQNAAMFA